MKFGVREICDVVLKAKANQKIGNKIFYKNEPVIYFDTLKTSSMEGAATTVYAQGGRGNSRLVAWEGERTVTFTMEDALISPAGFMILSGAGLIEAGSKDADGNVQYVMQHTTEQTDKVAVDATNKKVTITLAEEPFYYVKKDASGADTTEFDPDADDCIYVMFLDNGEVVTEPFVPTAVSGKTVTIDYSTSSAPYLTDKTAGGVIYNNAIVLVDYYVKRTSNAQQIDITPDKFGGNYYLEASTLFRDTNGVDMPAEFIIPNCKIQSNFTFTMASSGDPSTFTFTMDAFPDYTRWNKTKKVLAAIQIISDSVGSGSVLEREATPTARIEDANGLIVNPVVAPDSKPDEPVTPNPDDSTEGEG